MSLKHASLGFTLIELMISIAVLSLVIGIAVPSFQTVIENNRSIVLANDLVASMHYARSEAVKRGVSVSICATANQNFTSCGNSWNQGWLVFVNPDGNGTFDNDATEILLRAQQQPPQTASITANPNLSIITYTATGFPDVTSSNLSVNILTSGCTNDHGRNITLNFVGRPQLTPLTC